ncbi:MAG: DUF2283 domain-containing protein [Elusimicrobiota bacterium]
MRLKVDKKSDALYFRLDDSPIVESEEVRPGIIIDFDKNGKPIGVEFLNIKSRISEKELSSIQFQAS